jgi:hypothetical protein
MANLGKWFLDWLELDKYNSVAALNSNIIAYLGIKIFRWAISTLW